jgi:hypothetical protein
VLPRFTDVKKYNVLTVYMTKYINTVNNKTYSSFPNASVDIISQQGIKTIPKERLVILDHAPYNVHTLHKFLSTTNGKHPMYPTKSVPKHIIDKVKQKAMNTGLSNTDSMQTNNSISNNNRRVPNSLRQSVSSQSKLMQKRLYRQRQSIARDLLNNNAAAMERIESIAKEVKSLNAKEYKLPADGFMMRIHKGRQGQISRIIMEWSTPRKPFNQRRANHNNKIKQIVVLHPVEVTNSGLLMYNHVPVNSVHAAAWLMELLVYPSPSTPGSSRVPVNKMTSALSALLGLKIATEMSQANLSRYLRLQTPNNGFMTSIAAIEAGIQQRLRHVDTITTGQSIRERVKEVLHTLKSIDRLCARTHNNSQCQLTIYEVNNKRQNLSMARNLNMQAINTATSNINGSIVRVKADLYLPVYQDGVGLTVTVTGNSIEPMFYD